MGVGVQAQRRVGNIDPAQRLLGLGASLGGGDAGIAAAQDIHKMRADGEDRVKGGGRILKNHRNSFAAPVFQGFEGQGGEVGAVHVDAAGEAGDVGGEEAEDGEGEGGFAGAAFADDAEDAAAADFEVDAAQDVGGAAGGAGLEAEVLDGDEWRHDRRALGSVASRRASPKRVKPRVATARAMLLTRTGRALSLR